MKGSSNQNRLSHQSSTNLSGTGFFLKAGNLGMVPRKPKPKPDRKLPVVSMLSRCLSKKLEMSSTRGMRGKLVFEALSSLGIGTGTVSETALGASITFLLLLVALLLDADGTFEC